MCSSDLLTGRPADLLLSSLNVGNQQREGSMAYDFKFDNGTLDTTALNIGFGTTVYSGTGSNSPTLAATVTLGGGTVAVGTGAITMGAVNDLSTKATKIYSGALNISGGTVTVDTTGTYSIQLGNNTSTGVTVNETINLTGGTLTVAGDIVQGSTTRTTGTLVLNGGTLDMGGKNIGGNGSSTGNLTNLTFSAGTLRNVLEINKIGRAHV